MTRSRGRQHNVMFALAALGLGNLMLAQDLAALNVALASIERDLDLNLSTAQWVINAYLLVYGMLIVTGGRLADELGRRRLFLVGAAIFAVASVLGGLAPNVSWLIGARALMGIGSGLMLPSISGMAYAALPEERAELAGGLIVGAYAIGMAMGPIAGGALTEFLGWRWIQFINLPIALLAMFGVWRAIPPDAASGRATIDYAGILTLSAGLVSLLFALGQASAWGWGDWRIVTCLGFSILLFLAFFALERRAGDAALIPSDLLRNRGVALGCALRALMAPVYAATLLYLPQVMQKLLDFSPVQSGFGMLPMLGGYTLVSLLVGSLAGRISTRIAIIIGLVGLTIGPYLLSGFSVAAGYPALVVGLVLTGVGLGLFQPSIGTEAVKADPRGRKSLASGLVLMSQFVGGALGLGVTTAIVAAAERSAVAAHLAGVGIVVSTGERTALDKMLAGAESAQQVLRQFDPPVAARLIGVAGEAFAAGVRSGLRVDAGIVAVGVGLALFMLGRPGRNAVKRPD